MSDARQASDFVPVDALLPAGTMVLIVARVVRVFELEGGHFSVVTRIDNPENGFRQLAAIPAEAIRVLARPRITEGLIDRLTNRLLGD